MAKWLAMLKEIAPQLRRAAFMANPKTTPFDYWLPEAEAAARSLAIELLPSRVESAADIEGAIESVASAPNGGISFPRIPGIVGHANETLRRDDRVLNRHGRALR